MMDRECSEGLSTSTVYEKHEEAGAIILIGRRITTEGLASQLGISQSSDDNLMDAIIFLISVSTG